MNDLRLVDSMKTREIIRAAALAWHQPERIDELAATCNITPTVLAEMLTNPIALTEIIRELARMRRSGELLSELAAPVMEKFLKRAEAVMNDPDLPITTAAKVTDTVFKLSGLGEARSVVLHHEAGQPRPTVSLIIQQEDDPEPPEMQPGELRLCIVAPTKERAIAGTIINDQ